MYIGLHIGRYLDNETIDDEWRRRRVERAERALASSLATVSLLIKIMVNTAWIKPIILCNMW